MSGLFDNYKRDYDASARQLEETVARLEEGLARQRAHAADSTRVYTPPPATGPASRAQTVAAAQQLAETLRECAESMGFELNDMPQEARAAARGEVERCRREAQRRAERVAELRRECVAADRADLVAYTGGGDMMDEADADTKAARLQALGATETLQRGSATLKKTEALLGQANDMGRESLGTLRAQTEQIERIRETTHDVDGEISEARQVIAQMQRTAIKHKIWLYGIIVMLLLFVALIVYIKVK